MANPTQQDCLKAQEDWPWACLCRGTEHNTNCSGRIREAIAIARAETREACAKLVDDWRAGFMSQMADVHSLAAAIRQLGEKYPNG